MSKLKLKINVNLLQRMWIVVSVALHGEFERFGGFCVDFAEKDEDMIDPVAVLHTT